MVGEASVDNVDVHSGKLVMSASVTQNIAVDTNSLYHLHPSDHPRLIFVTHPVTHY